MGWGYPCPPNHLTTDWYSALQPSNLALSYAQRETTKPHKQITFYMCTATCVDAFSAINDGPMVASSFAMWMASSGVLGGPGVVMGLAVAAPWS